MQILLVYISYKNYLSITDVLPSTTPRQLEVTKYHHADL